MKKITLLMVALLLSVMGVKADVEWTLWEGSQSFDTDTGGTTDIGSYCRSIQIGDVLTFTVVDLGNYSFHQKALDVKSETGSWSTTQIANYDNFTEAEISACAYTQVVTDKMYEEIVTNSGMFDVGGKGYTLTKVTATRSLNSCIKTSLAELTGNGSFDGSKLNNAFAGDYIYVEATVSGNDGYGEYKLEGNNVSTLTYKVYDKLLLTLTQEQITAWTSNSTWPWSTLTNLSAADIYLIHPVSSFNIGSIGMATFSADQQVTAPDNVTAYKATRNGSSVSLTPFTNNVIPANTGAIIKGNEGAVLEFTASSESTSETSDLFACTSATVVTTLESGYDYYVLYASKTESETTLELSTLLSGISDWGGKVTVSGNTAEWTSTSTSSAMGKWLGTDWSSYDKLRLVFTSNTVADNVHFGISYNDPNAADTGADLATGGLTVDIPLNDSYKNAIGNFSFNSNATSGSLTFKSAALIDNDGATVAEFRKTESGTLAANKAYLKIPQGTLARAVSIVFEEDNFTGINTIEKKKTVTRNDDIIYNLNGQVVTNPSKGIYIKNGKKFVVK